MNIDLTTSDTNSVKRQKYYSELKEQLDKLWHDIDAGKFGDAAKTLSLIHISEPTRPY